MVISQCTTILRLKKVHQHRFASTFYREDPSKLVVLTVRLTCGVVDVWNRSSSTNYLAVSIDSVVSRITTDIVSRELSTINVDSGESESAIWNWATSSKFFVTIKLLEFAIRKCWRCHGHRPWHCIAGIIVTCFTLFWDCYHSRFIIKALRILDRAGCKPGRGANKVSFIFEITVFVNRGVYDVVWPINLI